MNILVTGSSGWLGQTLVPRLSRDGHRVVGLDPEPGPTTEIVGSVVDRAVVRRIIRERIAAGDRPDDIRAWLVTRYGDFVLYRPPLKPTTYLLWAGPFALQLVGIALLVRYLRRRNRKDGRKALNEAEKERVDAL